MSSLRIHPADATLGARVEGVDLRCVSDGTFGEIEAAWLAHAVLLFPDQDLSNAEQIAFSRRFGALERLQTKHGVGDDPRILTFTNLRPDGSLDMPGDTHELFHRGNQYWHSDSSFKRLPAKASLLAAREIPSEGGETQFADMRAAYDVLDDDLKAWLEDKRALHSYRYSQGLIGGLETLSAEELEALPPVEHPVVTVHPATGRKNLYIGRHASHILGEDPERGRALLMELGEKACRPPRVFTHRWRPGDVVIWDNRCVLHRGRPWPHDQVRIMTRTTIANEAARNEWVL
jgi:alpha-ketoglutarate-dependent taurine dioxygenase